MPFAAVTLATDVAPERQASQHSGRHPLGDTVNIAARLSSAAEPSEVLVTLDAAGAADLDTAGLERRDLQLKGRSNATSVLVLAASRLD